MSDIFKQDQPCDNCGVVFARQDLTRYRNHLYCPNCLQEVRTPNEAKDQSLGEKAGNTMSDEVIVNELEDTRLQIATLEGKLNELQAAISGVSAGTTTVTQKIAGALQNIAEQLKDVTATPPPDGKIPLNGNTQEPVTLDSLPLQVPPLPVPEFQVSTETNVLRLVHTPSIINWGAVLDLTIQCGWHRSYHVFLAFLRMLDARFSDILSQNYKGKPGKAEVPDPGSSNPPSLYSAWISPMKAHLPLLQSKGLQWRDFVGPNGMGQRRNADARWQQAVVDYLIAQQNAPRSSREIADALLPSFPSTSDENVRWRMLQNIVAALARRNILALKDPTGFPKLFWIPDCRQ